MNSYLDHEFENEKCVLCGEAEKSVRYYHTFCKTPSQVPASATQSDAQPPVAVPYEAPAAASPQAPGLPSKTTRACPFCAEEVLAAAKLCKHCKSRIEPTAAAEETSVSATNATTPTSDAAVSGAGARRDDPIFANAGVRVTRARVSFASGVDYPIAAISSVRLGTGVNPSRGLGVVAMLGGAFLGLIGLVLAVAASQDSSASPIFGVLLIVAAAVGIFFGAQLSNAPLPWVVFITTSGREQQAMSGDRKTMEEIVRAVRSAIDARG